MSSHPVDHHLPHPHLTELGHELGHELAGELDRAHRVTRVVGLVAATGVAVAVFAASAGTGGGIGAGGGPDGSTGVFLQPQVRISLMPTREADMPEAPRHPVAPPSPMMLGLR